MPQARRPVPRLAGRGCHHDDDFRARGLFSRVAAIAVWHQHSALEAKLPQPCGNNPAAVGSKATVLVRYWRRKLGTLGLSLALARESRDGIRGGGTP